MFDAEKLLGKVLSGVMGTSSSSHKGKSSLLGSLASGGGLMTAIGLGIGAYEILKEKKQSQPAPPGYQAGPPPPPSAPAWGGPTMPPPPPPPLSASLPNSPPVIAASTSRKDSQELAIRLIRVMIAAAHADGTLDEEEEKAVLARLRTTDLSQEERMFILDELHQPKTLAELTTGISDPSIAKTMYMLATSAIAIDSPGERAWLDSLAASLSISKAVQAFIEEQR